MEQYQLLEGGRVRGLFAGLLAKYSLGERTPWDHGETRLESEFRPNLDVASLAERWDFVLESLSDHDSAIRSPDGRHGPVKYELANLFHVEWLQWAFSKQERRNYNLFCRDWRICTLGDLATISQFEAMDAIWDEHLGVFIKLALHKHGMSLREF